MSESNTPGPDNPIDETTARWIRGKSRQIVRQAGRSRAEREDIEQALTLRLLQSLRAYDSTQLPRGAYIRMVLRRATASVLRYLGAAKRNGPEVVSLEAFLRGAADEPLEPVDRPDRRSGAEAADLVWDVAGLLGVLPPDLRRLAEQLQSLPVAAIARHQDVSRTTVHARLNELRSRFRRAGLEDYF